MASNTFDINLAVFINYLTQIDNNEMNIISSWFSANLLSLTLRKTNYILFGNKKCLTLVLN